MVMCLPFQKFSMNWLVALQTPSTCFKRFTKRWEHRLDVCRASEGLNIEHLLILYKKHNAIDWLVRLIGTRSFGFYNEYNFSKRTVLYRVRQNSGAKNGGRWRFNVNLNLSAAVECKLIYNELTKMAATNGRTKTQTKLIRLTLTRQKSTISLSNYRRVA